MSSGDWCLLESDPGLFSALIREFGSTGAQVDELWGLDPEVFKPLGKIFGLIFLFKWDGKKETQSQGKVVDSADYPEMFYARQVINNACGTQALLSVLLNIKDDGVDLGKTLQNFQEFASALDAETRGHCLSNCDDIREVHNSFSRQQLFELDDRNAPKDNDVFHFVSYIPFNGRLWELDGLQGGPIDHGPIESSDWLDAARPTIQQRMQKYAEGEIHFNLLAVCQDKLIKLNQELEKFKVESNEFMKNQTEEEIKNETDKRARWAKDNIRRRHNFLPLVMEIIKQMASQKSLVPAVTKAEERTKAAIERKRQREKAQK